METVSNPVINATQIKHIDGENFSGRSSYLQSLIKSDTILKNHQPFGVMVGEIPANYISGLAPTVENEISLHKTGTNKSFEKRLNNLLSMLLFDKHLEKNPFNLSGGEQAILIIICSLLLEPKHLAIDTTLEQLNRAWRTPLLLELSNPDFIATNISIADNRFSEYILNAQKLKPSLHSRMESDVVHGLGRIISPFTIGLKSVAKNLSMNNLNFGYSKKQMLLKDLNYEFESGNIYHLNGINGAGKSTLSKILTGVLKPSSGKIYLSNLHYDAYRFPGKVVGYSFQNPDEQIFSLTVMEEVLPKQLFKENKNIEMAKAIFSSFGLSNFAKSHPSEMPFVIRKRIALAATLANERDWYILDEPTIGQDQRNVEEITKLIKLLALNGKGIILISHSEQFVSSFENLKTLTISNGKIIT